MKKNYIFALILIIMIFSAGCGVGYGVSESERIWFSEDPEKEGVFWLGMTVAEAEKAFSENGLTAEVWSLTDEYPRVMYTNEFELQFLTFDEDGKLETFTVRSRPRYVDNTDNIRMRTEKGIRVGDSFAKVEELYGKPFRFEKGDSVYPVIYHYKLDVNYFLTFWAWGPTDIVDGFQYNVADYQPL